MSRRSYAIPFAMLATCAAVRAQDEMITVPPAVLQDAGDILPERSHAARNLIAPAWFPNLVISQTCQVRVAFLWDGAGYENSVGWFLWRESPSGTQIVDSAMLFPNASFAPQGSLETGATCWLRAADGSRATFQDGDRIGFFMIADGWRTANQVVTGWTRGGPLPSLDPQVNDGVGLGLYTTIDDINPELAHGGHHHQSRHFAMLRMEGRADFLEGRSWFLCGVEDLDRQGADEDFNDVVLAIDVQPPLAAAGTRVPGHDKSDLDGDGVRGLDDLFPLDPDRAWIRNEPDSGLTVVAFEDFYPTRTDSDFNDAVLAFRFVSATSSHNAVKELFGEFHLVARGASFEHSFGIHLAGIPEGATGTLEIQRFLSGDGEAQPVETRDLAEVLREGRRIDDVFPSTRAALPQATPDKPFANTWPGYPTVPAGSARIRIVFDTPVESRQFGTAPFDPYLIVTTPDGIRADVHLPGFDAFADRSPGLPTEHGPTAFIHTDGSAWALLVPMAWRFPMEGVPIRTGLSAVRRMGAERRSPGEDLVLLADHRARQGVGADRAAPAAAHVDVAGAARGSVTRARGRRDGATTARACGAHSPTITTRSLDPDTPSGLAAASRTTHW